MIASIEQLIVVLEKHGAWALVALLGVAVVAMARYIAKIHADHKTEISGVLAERREDTRELTEAIVTTGASIAQMRQTFVALLEDRNDQDRDA